MVAGDGTVVASSVGAALVAAGPVVEGCVVAGPLVVGVAGVVAGDDAEAVGVVPVSGATGNEVVAPPTEVDGRTVDDGATATATVEEVAAVALLPAVGADRPDELHAATAKARRHTTTGRGDRIAEG